MHLLIKEAIDFVLDNGGSVGVVKNAISGEFEYDLHNSLSAKLIIRHIEGKVFVVTDYAPPENVTCLSEIVLIAYKQLFLGGPRNPLHL